MHVTSDIICLSINEAIHCIINTCKPKTNSWKNTDTMGEFSDIYNFPTTPWQLKSRK